MGLSVDLDPDTSVVFTGDFCSSTTTTLSIKNLDADNSIVFKIKTNAPQRYVVKPHKGSIGPSDTVTVIMTLLPFNFKETEKYPDKFLIQASMLILILTETLLRYLLRRITILGASTVTYTESGAPMLNWESRHICHFSTEMAEIWSPGTSFQDVWVP